MCQASNTLQQVSIQEGHVPLFCPLYTYTCNRHARTHTHTLTHIHTQTHTQWGVKKCELAQLRSPYGLLSRGCPKVPCGTCWDLLTHNQNLRRRGPSCHKQWHEHLSVWTLLCPERLKVGQQQQNILFSWPSLVTWAGKWEVIECSFLVTTVVNQLWASHLGSELSFSILQPLDIFLQSDLSRAPSW